MNLLEAFVLLSGLSLVFVFSMRVERYLALGLAGVYAWSAVDGARSSVTGMYFLLAATAWLAVWKHGQSQAGVRSWRGRLAASAFLAMHALFVVAPGSRKTVDFALGITALVYACCVVVGAAAKAGRAFILNYF